MLPPFLRGFPSLFFGLSLLIFYHIEYLFYLYFYTPIQIKIQPVKINPIKPGPLGWLYSRI